MQQTINCPSCGSPINESQKFCGVCGLNLESIVKKQTNACPTCGLPISPGQQFCGSCGTKLAAVEQQPPPETQPTPTQSISQNATAAAEASPATVATKQATTPRRRGILNAAAIVFQIFGWIILVFGILASIAMAVFAAMGGSLMPAIPGMATLGGLSAIGIAIGGIVISLLYGLGFLAFAEICYAVMDLRK